jgi:hypothetical protein
MDDFKHAMLFVSFSIGIILILVICILYEQKSERDTMVSAGYVWVPATSTRGRWVKVTEVQQITQSRNKEEDK